MGSSKSLGASKGAEVLCKIPVCKSVYVSQAGRCEERNVFWESKTALSFAAVGPV